MAEKNTKDLRAALKTVEKKQYERRMKALYNNGIIFIIIFHYHK